MSKLVEVIRGTPQAEDPAYRFTVGEKLWLDDYTAHNMVLIGIARYAKPECEVSRETQRLV